jgi:hypothetical protein
MPTILPKPALVPDEPDADSEIDIKDAGGVVVPGWAR